MAQLYPELAVAQNERGGLLAGIPSYLPSFLCLVLSSFSFSFLSFLFLFFFFPFSSSFLALPCLALPCLALPFLACPFLSYYFLTNLFTVPSIMMSLTCVTTHVTNIATLTSRTPLLWCHYPLYYDPLQWRHLPLYYDLTRWSSFAPSQFIGDGWSVD